MPQGDDYVSSNPDPAPAPEPVDPQIPAVPASTPGDPPASAPGDDDMTPDPSETPEQRQSRADDRRYAAWRRQRRIEEQAVELARKDAELAALKAQIQAASPPPQVPSPADPTQRPDAENYATHEEWVEAVSDWKAEQRIQAYDRAKQAEAAAQRQRTEAATLQERWSAQEAVIRETHADYDAVLEADTTVYHPALLANIQDSAVGAHLAYHLATHPEEARTLAQLPPGAALRALGKLEARLEGTAGPPATPSPPNNTPTPQARPRPLTPVGGPGGAVSTREPGQMDHDEFRVWYKKTYGHD